MDKTHNFIKRSHVQEAFGLSKEMAIRNFSSYKKRLAAQGKQQVHKDYLPKEWFIGEFAKNTGLPIENVRENIEKALRKEDQ